MKQQTILKSTLCLLMALVCNVTWAQIEVSTSVDTPEHVYRIKSKNGYWMTSCTSLGDEANSSVFAFFASGEGAYKVYSVERQKWVSYFKATEYTGSTNRAILVDTQDEANAWKVTASGDYYLFAPYLSNGNVAGFYWNWFEGIGSNPSNNVTITVGLYNSNSDGGSLWALSKVEGFDFTQIVDLNGTFTDQIGQAYSCTYKGIQGKTKPVVFGGGVATISDEAWNGNAYTAKISFPFMPSNAEVTNHVVISPYNGFNKKYYASGTDVKSNNGMDTSLPTDVKYYLWAFYPTFTDDGFKVKIKNVGTGAYIFSDLTAQSHGADDVSLKAVGEASSFTIIGDNQIINESGKYLSVSSSSNGQKDVGNYHKDHNGTKNKFVAANNYTLTLSDESTYSGTNGVHNVQGGNYTYTDGVWDENGYSATMDDFSFASLPFPVSEKGGSTKATMISSFSSGTNKWYADGANICAVLNKQPSITNLNAYLWAIYPTLNEGTFTFIIKNIATNKYVYTTSTGDSHNAGTVTLSTEATSFTFDNNKFKIFKGEKFLSMNSSDATGVQYVGTWGSHKGCNTTYPDLTDYTVTTDASGYTAIYTPIAVTIPDGVTAYTGKLNATNTILSLDTIRSAIPANTAVILSGAASTTYTFSKHSDEVAAIEGNNLQGAETSIEVANIEGNAYTFQYSDGTASFAKVTEGSIPGYTAYIAVESEEESILIKEFEKALITANQAKLGQGIGYAYYTANGNKLYTADAVNAAIDAATTAEEVNAIKESFKYEIPMAGVPYALYDATHNVYLDIHNLGKEKNDASQNRLATLGASAQPLYITGNASNGTWKIHTTPEGGEYLHQAGGKRNWNSWVSNEPGDFSWGVEVCTSEGEITYNLKKLSGGYLGTDISLHKADEPLYVNVEAAKALNLKLIALPVLAVNNLDAEGITYPYALPDEKAAKVFPIENLTIAMDVTMGATTSNNEAFICASDISVDSDNSTYDNNSTFVAMGTEGGKIRYFASAKSGGWYTANTSQLTASRNHKVVIVMDKAQNIRKVYVDGTAANITNYQDFNHFKDNKNAGIFIGGGKNSVGDKYVFNGEVHSVQFYNYALTTEEIATIEYPVTDKQEADALKALIAETQELINSCYNYYSKEALLTSSQEAEGYYVWANAPQSGAPVGNLFDGDANTIFHSNWESTTAPEDGLDHHITIELGEDAISLFKFSYKARSGNGLGDYPKTIKVQGSTDGINYDDIATVEPRSANGSTIENGAEWTSEVLGNGNAYNYLRFMVTATTTNKNTDGHIYWHMAEFDLMPHQAEPVSNYPNSVVLPTTLETTKAAIAIAQEEADKNQTAAEFAAATEALQTAYDKLAAAIANGNRPILISLDPEKPYIYKIGSKRGNTKVLQLDYSGDPKQLVAVVDYDATNMEQAWYFTKGSDDEKVFIHPFMAEGNVLSASSTNNAKNAVWAAAKGAEPHQELKVQVVDNANGTYNIKAGNGSNYFSHNGGFSATKYMGFWSDDNTTDGGSLFTFELVELKDILEAYKDTHCAKESYAVGEGLGYYQGGATYNEARVAVVEVLADEEATAEDYKNAYIALRDAKGALKFLTPEAGKFYRIKSVAGWNDDAPYLGSANSTAKDGRAEFVETANANTIFYFDGNNLLSYGSGLYLVSNSSMLGYNGVQTSGSKVAFHAAAKGLEGAFNISFDNVTRYLYTNKDNYTDGGSGTNNDDGYCFTVEEVTSLPVVISNAQVNFNGATKCVSTLFTPVALEVPVGITAYIGVNEDNYLAMEPIEAGDGAEKAIIPAGTGVILMADAAGTYNFTISAETDTAIEPGANIITGTVAKTLITPVGTTCYVLAAKNGNVGLYIASLNYYSDGNKVAQDAKDGTSFYNNAGKAYLPVVNDDADDDPAPEALAFRFGRGQDTTEIELPTAKGQQPTAVYDLQGRRVLNPTKGIYIVNGKKVLF